MNIYSLIPLVTCCFYLLLLLFSLQQFKSNRTTRYFVYYLGVAAFWSFTSFMVHLDAPAEHTLFWNEILVVALGWTAVAYYQFALAYVGKKSVVMVYAGYAVLVVLGILSLNGYAVEYSYVIDGVVSHALGPVSYAVGGVGGVFAVMVISMLLGKYRSTTDPLERNRTMYLIFGWVILVLFTYTNLIPPMAYLPLDHLGSFINAFIITYAITRFQLLNIKVVARAIITYSCTVLIIVGICAGSILLVYHFFHGQPTTGFILISVIIVLLMVATYQPLRNIVQKITDRIFYPTNYQSRQELLGFTARMGHILNLQELADEMLLPLCKAVNVDWAGLMLQNSEDGGFDIQFVKPDTARAEKQLSLSADSLMLSWLDENEQPLMSGNIDNIPELRGLWQVEKEQIMQSEAGLFYPMKSRGRMICILVLGRKQNHKIFSHEDIEIITGIANQAAIIIANAQLYTQAVIRANTDGLTGLYNHRHFHERLEQEIARGSRFGSTFSLVFMDIDLFKTYNDAYGHLAGDQVLRRVGQCIKNSVRSIDLPFRYGGEEFAVILPEARLDDAYKVAERIRKTIEANASLHTMPVTVSLGIANWPADGIMREEIIKRADAALYRAKQLGRNQTCLSTDMLKTTTDTISMEMEAQPKALSIIYALAATVDAKDSYTYGHSRKVSEYAVRMAELMDMPADRINTIRAAGLLHDIGKIGVPDSVLNKRSILSEEEWKPIRLHPELGVEILKHVIDLINCLPAINYHHEHYDGSGYPGGIKGDNIPVEARILAIADAYDAMTSPRPYREQLSGKDALAEIRRCAGTQFDPELAEIFCSMMDSQLSALDNHSMDIDMDTGGTG